MMNVEYGIGVKNRFAFLGDDGDNDDKILGTVGSIKSMPNETSTGKKNLGSKEVARPGPGGKTKTSVVAAGRNTEGKEKALKGRNQQTVQDEKMGGRRDNDGFGNERRFHQGPRRQDTGRGYRREGPPAGRRSPKNRYKDDTEEQKDSGISNAPEATGKDEDTEGTKDLEANAEKADDAQEEENVKSAERTLTLAEWKALQAPREKPTFNIRKPGEGEVISKLEKLVLKKKEELEEDNLDHVEEYEIDNAYYPQRAGKMKLISDVGFTTGYQHKRRGGRFSNTARAGGGDGHVRASPTDFEQVNTPDKPRTPRGRVGFPYRGGQRASQVLRIDDTTDFPTLG